MKRDRFISELNKEARRLGEQFRIEKGKGKGSHFKAYFRGKVTIIQSGDLTPLRMRTIRKQLGFPDQER